MRAGWILACLFLCFSPALVCAAPILRINDPVWNVGQIVAGQEQRHSIEIENGGDEELIISEVDNCCGFIGILEQNRLLPGQRTLLALRLKQTKMIGNLYAEVVLVSNDPQQPRAAIRVNGDVLPTQYALGEVLLPEGFVDLGVIPPGQPAPFKVRVRSIGNQPLQIVGVDRKRSVLESGTRPVLAPGEEGELTFRYLREESGVIDEELFLVTNDPLARTLAVRLKGYVFKEVLPRAALIISPVGEPLVYNQELGGFSYRIQIENRADRPVEVLPPASSLPPVVIRGGGVIAPGEKGSATVVYPLDAARSGPVDGRVYLQLVLPVVSR